MKLEYFMMIDKVEAIDINSGFLCTSSMVPEKSTVFEGHFPNYPLVPGVLLVETMAQASGMLMLRSSDYFYLPLLAGIKEAKIRDPVRPGTKLDVETRIEYSGSKFCLFKANIKSNGKRIANAQLVMVEIDWPSLDFKQIMKNQIEDIFIRSE